MMKKMLFRLRLHSKFENRHNKEKKVARTGQQQQASIDRLPKNGEGEAKEGRQRILNGQVFIFVDIEDTETSL